METKGEKIFFYILGWIIFTLASIFRLKYWAIVVNPSYSKKDRTAKINKLDNYKTTENYRDRPKGEWKYIGGDNDELPAIWLKE